MPRVVKSSIREPLLAEMGVVVSQMPNAVANNMAGVAGLHEIDPWLRWV